MVSGAFSPPMSVWTQPGCSITQVIGFALTVEGPNRVHMQVCSVDLEVVERLKSLPDRRHHSGLEQFLERLRRRPREVEIGRAHV